MGKWGKGRNGDNEDLSDCHPRLWGWKPVLFGNHMPQQLRAVHTAGEEQGHLYPTSHHFLLGGLFPRMLIFWNLVCFVGQVESGLLALEDI